MRSAPAVSSLDRRTLSHGAAQVAPAGCRSHFIGFRVARTLAPRVPALSAPSAFGIHRLPTGALPSPKKKLAIRVRDVAHGLQTWLTYMAAAGVYRGGMDNDGLHKFAYRLRAMFADLLRLAVPALAAELDFARAELLPTSHVAAAGARFKQRHGDLTWLVPHRRGDGLRPQLVAVVEFQSTVDQSMAERMREYCRMLRESPQLGSARGLALAGKSPQRGSARGLPLAGKSPQPGQFAGGREAHWPALLPLVVYNGSERWTAPGAVAELPPQWSAAARYALAPFQAWDYVLLSLERLLGGDQVRCADGRAAGGPARRRHFHGADGTRGRLDHGVRTWRRSAGASGRHASERRRRELNRCRRGDSPFNCAPSGTDPG